MPVITLTTEWKPDDVYYGIIKGKLCSASPGTMIIDNAGSIPVFNILHASFVIRNTFINYPKGSVHIICVHSESNKDQDHLIVKARDHFFIGADNGIFHLILNSEPDEVIKLDQEGNTDELDIFSRAAGDLISGKKLSDLGTPVTKINEKFPLRATIDKDKIIGSILFIDSYGNAISNITRDLFYRVFENKEYRILIRRNSNFTEKISQKYSDVPVNEILAKFNQLDLLEMALNGVDISDTFTISIGDAVRVESKNKPVLPDQLF